ncbi:MAG TPA: TonB-dependent receptor [Candidatus Cybelea sp.]|nr:TonB-dependent receptor [Candidatus Cybelea sp.]
MGRLELRASQQATKHLVGVLLALALSVGAGAARAMTAQGESTQSSGGTIQGVVTVLGQQAEASSLEGIRVELEESSQDAELLSALTDSMGHFEFTKLPAGTYTLRVNQQGFKPFAETVSLNANQSAVANIALAFDTVVEKVEVKEQTASLPTEKSSPASTINNAQLETLPLAQQKFRDALPVVPGVIRTLDGKLSVRGSSENQGMLQVDSAKMVDPVTGSFSIPVPIDAIQAVNVEKTPFSAENGGFSGGLTTIETTPPPSDWFYKVKDFNVSLRGKNGHFVGVSQATPRVSFGGPVGDGGRWSFSEVYEYDVRRDPVRGLAWPQNEIKSQGFNSFTRVQAILSPEHVFNADVNVFPMRTEFANITALVPQTAASDYDQKGVSAGISDFHSFQSGALLRIALRYTRFDSNAHGQGPVDMLVNPEGWEGNFFNSWTRAANQFEAYPTFQFAPKKWLGRHEFKIGTDVTHRSYDGNSLSHPIQVLRQDGTLAEEIRFASNGPLGASATDVEEFIEDRWMLNDHLSIDVGGRLTSQTVGRTGALGPRAGFAYSPGKNQKTVFRAGAGLFYDRVSLLEADFVHNPQRTISFFDETGQLSGSPIPYVNAFIGNGASSLASRVRSGPGSSPRSFVGNIEVDRQLWGNAVVRVSYIYSQTRDLFVVNPIPGVFGSAGLLGLFPAGQANYHEFEATLHFQPVHGADLNVSYIWSRARGDLNTVSNIFLPFEQPVIRPNVSGILPSDVPHRVVSWGVIHLPWSLTASPVVDVHTGFPYSNVDVLQNYAGVPNGARFPTFFSVDTQVYRDFRLHLPFLERGSKHKVRVGLYSINLTNHGNFREVYNNMSSPFFGQFTGFQRRVDGFILSFAD